MKFSEFLTEKKKEEEKKIVFKETDGVSPFPENTVSALKKEISNLARDLEQEWDSVQTLLTAAYENLDVPQPQAYQKDRWYQHIDLINHATEQLYKSRGLKASWSQGI